MCLILFAYKQRADYPLVVLANRDENYARPTQASQFWPERPQLLGGKDLLAGGTWMGVTRRGRFAAITNFRDGPAELTLPRSRGDITRDFLLSDMPARVFISEIKAQAQEYGGFNLLVSDGQDFLAYSNRQQSSSAIAVSPGVHGLSNAFLDSPWPKVSGGCAALAQALNTDELDTKAFFQIMQHPAPAADEDLPNTAIPLDMERLLSSRFIHTTGYGTRSTTLLLVDNNGIARWYEQLYDDDGSATDLCHYCFQIENT